MKQMILLLAIVLITGTTFSFNYENDVGKDQPMTTIKAESVKHETMLNGGWEFVKMTIKESPEGIKLVVDYKKGQKKITYTSGIVIDAVRETKVKKPKDKFKINVAFHSSGGNPGWRC